MKKTGAKKEERFAKKAGKTWLDPMCTPFETRQIRTGKKEEDRMKKDPLTGEKVMKEARHKAYKVGGIWVDPMCFPFLKDYK